MSGRAEERPLSTVAQVLDAAARVTADGRGRVNVPRLLQSWPGIAHGGGVVALLDAAGAALGVRNGSRIVEGRLTSSLPLDTDLTLESDAGPGAITLTILQGGQTLTSGTVRALDTLDSAASRWAGGGDGDTLPMSDDCLACGALNPVGLRLGLRFNDQGVWGRLTPSTAWRVPDGRLHPGLAPVLLDEVAWWVGALVAGEGGLTNRINLTIRAPEASWGEPLVAAGLFEDVTPVDRKRMFWRTETTLMTEAGVLVATASIVFRGGDEYSVRQMDYFRSRTPRNIFLRMFPRHA